MLWVYTMELVIFLVLVIGIFTVYKIKKPQKQGSNSKLPLKELVKKTFPKYKIIEKHQTVMICEINHRNEPEELVFIRITPNQQKSIKKSGRMLIADYPYIPTAKQLKLDFGQHLN